MRLVTWNVLWRFPPDWRAREDRILALLADLEPDVVGLQECWGTTDDSQAHVVARRLGMHAVFRAPSLPPVPVPPEHPDQDGVLMGVGLVSRWPVARVRAHALPVTHRQVAPAALEARILDATGTPFDVVVAATEWEPAFADDHLAQARRLAELLADAEPGVPRFLLADLNADESQAELGPLLEVAEDTWAQGGGDPTAVTLSSAVPFAPLAATKEIDRRVDHVLVTRAAGARVQRAFTVSSPVDGAYPSDHFPVVADVVLPAGAG